MDRKVLLILIDGLRADAVRACGNPYAASLLETSASTLNARTVFPSVTLPCHMSLFHSVDPDRHGILSNTYAPQVRPIEGLVDRLDRFEKKCAFFITWEELRDLSRPDHLAYLQLYNLHKNPNADDHITASALSYLASERPDFAFLYLGDTDEKGGHDTGWMSETYLQVVSNAFDCVKKMLEGIPAEYDVIVTADHGGHDRHHGSEMPEDMTIPIIANGPSFPAGLNLGNISIKDIAPTIAQMLDTTPAKEWEGVSFLPKKGE